MLLMSHPTGNPNVRYAASAFADSGLLQEFITCLSWNPESWINQVLPSALSRELSRRSFPNSVRPLIRTSPAREIGRLLAVRTGARRLTDHHRGILSVDSVYRRLDAYVAQRISEIPDIAAVYAYEDGADNTFAVARQRNIRCIYDLPIGYWRAAKAILQDEAERKPEWACTLHLGFETDARMERKDRELQNADLVVVASSFTKKTLSLAPSIGGPIVTIPYGATHPVCHRRKSSSRVLRVLYVGSLGQRKGLSYLIDAINPLSQHVELTLIGRSTSTCRPLNDALRKHRWIPTMPHSEVLNEMSGHDVLVLPSLFEGFGLVILEAISRGLVVITTPNTGGPEVLTEGQDGFIVPIRSSESIYQRLETLVRNRELLASMKQHALEKAAKLNWQKYQDSLVNVVCNCILNSYYACN